MLLWFRQCSLILGIGPTMMTSLSVQRIVRDLCQIGKHFLLITLGRHCISGSDMDLQMC